MFTYIKECINIGRFKTSIFEYEDNGEVLIAQGYAPEVLNKLKTSGKAPYLFWSCVVDIAENEILDVMNSEEWLCEIFGFTELEDINFDFCEKCCKHDPSDTGGCHPSQKSRKSKVKRGCQMFAMYDRS